VTGVAMLSPPHQPPKPLFDAEHLRVAAAVRNVSRAKRLILALLTALALAAIIYSAYSTR
jgi:hypothetical protein